MENEELVLQQYRETRELAIAHYRAIKMEYEKLSTHINALRMTIRGLSTLTGQHIPNEIQPPDVYGPGKGHGKPHVVEVK